MMKRLSRLFVILVLIFTLSFSMIACNDNPQTPQGGANSDVNGGGNDNGDGNLGGGSDNPGDVGGNEDEGKNEGEEDKKPEKLSFVSPVVGEVVKQHSLDMPVFSTTLNEWRVHTGIDISTEDGAEVFAAADGTVSRVYSDPLLGKSVEITHEGGIVSVYSNLSPTDIAIAEGDTVKSGALIGKVGDSSLSELAEEPHLHFGVKVNGVSVNPLDYISEESKKASLGITEV